uniref:Uncharacterized protein n=2 Tax=Noccaea caerulescens TaxID=107243 RepID=A0A1J3HLK0_NOCCA
MEKKLRRDFLVGKRAAPSTPPPTWRLGFSPPSRVGAFSKEFLTNSDVSVRKLCADLWEAEQFRQRIGLRRSRQRDSDVDSPSRSPLHDHQPSSRGSSRRHIAATDDHRNGDLLQPISPESCSSSEVMVRKPAFSQTGSSLVKSASYGLGSSTKLLKVLNRIWSLEEQNAANVSLVRALKMELDECRAEIKEVQQRENQSDRRKKKEEEEEELRDVFRSMKEELDDERKFRKQSEILHRKLTRELCEAKHCLTKALKDLEKERKERVAVENLCDELGLKEKRRSHLRKGSDYRAQHEDDSANSMHQRVCLKELEKRTRRDNKLQVMKGSLLNLSMSSEGDKIHPETSPKYVDDHHQIVRKSETFSKILPRNVNVREETRSRSLKDKLMEARVESRRLRSLKPESSPSHFVQA